MIGSYFWGEPANANLISHMGATVRVLDGSDTRMIPISMCTLPRIIEVCASLILGILNR